MGGLSYDTLFERHLREANVVIIDFDKQKIYLITHSQELEPIDFSIILVHLFKTY